MFLATLSSLSPRTRAFAVRSASLLRARDVRPSTGFPVCRLARTLPARPSVPSLVVRGGSSVAVEAGISPPKEIFRKDYAPLPYWVSNVSMNFDIRDGQTLVTSELTVRRNRKGDDVPADLILDGEADALTLLSLSVDGRELVPNVDYKIEGDALVVFSRLLSPLDEPARLVTKVRIHPEGNTQLSGLYKSGSMYCTQCEAMGFRRITYYPDRPDNMAVFDRVRIEADGDECPVLLGNGNKVEEGPADDDGRHYAVWSDPFPKPSYLFCIVAGKLSSVSSRYVTNPSGREVRLEIFSEPENVSKLGHAMESLKKSMKWDEDSFGLEYDLDVYNVVAVNDFNMGAMENKVGGSPRYALSSKPFLSPANLLHVLSRDSTSSTPPTYSRIPNLPRTRITNASNPLSPMNTSTTGREIESPVATGFSSPSKKVSPSTATKNSAET